MNQPANPSPAAVTGLTGFNEAPADSPHHVYINRCVQALAGCPMSVGMNVVLSLYRHLALTHPDKACTATAAFATAVLSQELTAAAGVAAAPSTIN